MRIHSYSREAAVLIVIDSNDDGARLLLTKRADTLREHAGEVAFPGGKQDAEDPDLYATALRECSEEVGICASNLTYKATLPKHFTRQGSAVTPFVSLVKTRPVLTLNEAEIDSVFWVPVSLFLEDKRVMTHVFRVGQTEFWAPVYSYQGYEIWGFTARVLVSFANQYFGRRIRREHDHAEEYLFA